jgi:hypothetical protein
MFDAFFAVVLILAVWKICELVYKPEDYNQETGETKKKANRNGPH